MKLNQLADSKSEMEISGVTQDSRWIKPGYLFGSLTEDRFIADAIAKGAAAVVVPENYQETIPAGVAVIRTPNPRKTFAEIAARYYGQQPPHICGITGTNGKTSIADFIRQILTMMGEKAASMGTLGLIKGNDAPLAYPNTTLISEQLHHDLARLEEEGYQYVAMEASSHGLEQYRMGGVHFEVAGFTNLTRDHLDYHKTMQNYLNAKLILFKELLIKGGTAVLNADIPEYPLIREACLGSGKKVITYGREGHELRLRKTTPLPQGQEIEIDYFGQKAIIDLPLAGEFQAMNVLCALGMAAKLSGRPDKVLEYAERIKGAKGRMDLAGQTASGAAIYIDYAHTPDALENVIRALRPHTKHQLHVVFGCGGDRDAGKRPIMGQIANDLADVVYVCDDNPRTENAENIRQQIMTSCPKGQNIGDRALAIKKAVAGLRQGDILIVAGKGHETGQYINGEVHHFSDYEEVMKNL